MWATALEVERPRRGSPVFVLLALAGLLRPDAWVLAGSTGCGARGRRARRSRRGRARGSGSRSSRVDRGAATATAARAARYLALVCAAPLLWVAIDTLVTGDPLYSLHSTAVLAAELERTKGFTSVLAATWRYLVRIDKLPIVLGGLAGALLAIWLTPAPRARAARGAGAAAVRVRRRGRRGRVGDRPLHDGAAALLLPFCALAIGGWSLLRPGSLLRRVWMAAGAALLVYGAVAAVSVTSLSNAAPRSPTTTTSTKGSPPPCTAPRCAPNWRAARCCRCPTTS